MLEELLRSSRHVRGTAESGRGRIREGRPGPAHKALALPQSSLFSEGMPARREVVSRRVTFHRRASLLLPVEAEGMEEGGCSRSRTRRSGVLSPPPLPPPAATPSHSPSLCTCFSAAPFNARPPGRGWQWCRLLQAGWGAWGRRRGCSAAGVPAPEHRGQVQRWGGCGQRTRGLQVA